MSAGATPEDSAEYLMYADAVTIAAKGIPPRVLIMAAFLTGEGRDIERLRQVYPWLYEELVARQFHSADGRIEADKANRQPQQTRGFLGREESTQ